MAFAGAMTQNTPPAPQWRGNYFQAGGVGLNRHLTVSFMNREKPRVATALFMLTPDGLETPSTLHDSTLPQSGGQADPATAPPGSRAYDK